MQYTDQDVQQVMDSQKCNRIKAIHLIKRLGVEKAVAFVKEAKAKSAAKPKAARKSVELPETCSEQVKIDREELDNVIRKALKEGYGRVVPVIAVLGQRFTKPSQKSGYPFYRVLADTGKDGLVTVFVGGFYAGGPGPKASIAPAVKSSYTVKAALARIAKREKRAATKAAEAKRTAAVPAGAVKIA